MSRRASNRTEPTLLFWHVTSRQEGPLTIVSRALHRLRRENDAACAETARLVGVHKLKGSELVRCSQLAEPNPRLNQVKDRHRERKSRVCSRPPRGSAKAQLEALATLAAYDDVVVEEPTTRPRAAKTSRSALFARPEEVPALPAGAPRKVAFCFLLAYGDVAQPDVWLRFWGRDPLNELAPGDREHMFSVYAHQDPAVGTRQLVRRPLWRSALLPLAQRVHTGYKNGSSLELARMALMAYAYHTDPSNYKFALVSESCVPLHALSHMHAVLTRDPRPRVHEIPDPIVNPIPRSVLAKNGPPIDKSRGKRWVPSLEPLLTERHRNAMLQSRQFVVAGRAEVQHYPPASEVGAIFGPMSRAEEHAFCMWLLLRCSNTSLPSRAASDSERSAFRDSRESRQSPRLPDGLPTGCRPRGGVRHLPALQS